MGEETEAQGTYEQGLNCPLVSSRARIWTQVSNLFSSDSQPHLIPWPELFYYNAGILLKIQGFTLALKIFVADVSGYCLKFKTHYLWKDGGGGLQNTQWEEVSVELRAHFWCHCLHCCWILLLNLWGSSTCLPPLLPSRAGAASCNSASLGSDLLPAIFSRQKCGSVDWIVYIEMAAFLLS